VIIISQKKKIELYSAISIIPTDYAMNPEDYELLKRSLWKPLASTGQFIKNFLDLLQISRRQPL